MELVRDLDSVGASSLDTYMEQLSVSIERNQPLVTPLMASIGVNTGCNSRCNYCWIWKDAVKNTPLADLLLAVDELAELGVPQINLAGGEPFLHPELPQIVQRIHDRKIWSAVVTNGTLLTAPRLQSVLDAGLNVLCFSLDTLDPATYQTIRGVPLARVLEGLARALKERRRFPKTSLQVNAVLSKANIDQLIPLVEFCRSIDVLFGVGPMHPTYASGHEPEGLTCSEEDVPRLRAVVAQLIDMKRRGYPITNQIPYLEGCVDYLVYRKLPKDFRCTAGFTSIIIDHELNVRNCGYMASPVGNLRSQKLTELWRSEACDRQRGDMLDLKCTKCWQRCQTEATSREWVHHFMEYTGVLRDSSSSVRV